MGKKSREQSRGRTCLNLDSIIAAKGEAKTLLFHSPRKQRREAEHNLGIINRRFPGLRLINRATDDQQGGGLKHLGARGLRQAVRIKHSPTDAMPV